MTELFSDLINLWNEALLTCGEGRIEPTTDSIAADLYRGTALTHVKYALSMHSWPFAKKTSTLVQQGMHEDGVTYVYTMPDDFLRIVEVEQGLYPNRYYDIEGRQITSQVNAADLVVTYTHAARVALWDADFKASIVLHFEGVIRKGVFGDKRDGDNDIDRARAMLEASMGRAQNSRGKVSRHKASRLLDVNYGGGRHG